MRIQLRHVLPLALVVLCASCSGKAKDEGGATSGETQASTATTGAGAEGTPQARGKGVDALVDLIVAQAAELPRAEFDPAALAQQLGKDPQAHFEWVRDHTWWAPYRGLLRGSRGVLLDRVGSNLDRAVLLAELLSRSGHEVRLAHAELSQGRARELLGKIRSTPDRRSHAAAQGNAPNERKLIEEKASALVDAQSKELYLMVKDAAAKAGTRDEALAIEAMRDYWWVERKEKGAWQELDILLPDSQPGSALAAASSTSAWNAKESRADVPEADWHTVQLRLVIERYEGGKTTEVAVLERLLRPAELIDRPILLMQMPKPWPDKFPDTSADPNARGNAAVNVKEWVPVLQIGHELFAQSGFTDDGNLIAGPFDAKRDIAKTGGGGFMSGFGEALGGGGETASSALTAEWLDYEIRVPGADIQHLRRPVFDLLGPAKREAKAADFDASTNERLVERYEAMLSATQILLQVSDFTGAFLAYLGSQSIADNQATIREFAKETDPAKAGKLAAAILDRVDIWGPLPALALWRAKLGGRPRISFVDRPNVLSYRIGGPVVNADRVAFREQIDIASNSTGVTWGSSDDPFELRVRQGVADTVAEVLALGGDFDSTQNTSVLFEKAGNDPDRGKFVGARDSSLIKELAWPEDAAARLSGDVDAGFVAVALRQPVSLDERPRVGWWRVDSVSGTTIGVMDTGFHGGMDERVETETEIVQLRNACRNWYTDNMKRIKAARARANLPWEAAEPGDAELLQTADRVLDVLKQALEAGFA